MDTQNRGGGQFSVSNLGINCAECGTLIETLPFEPRKRDDGTYGPLYCFECNKQRRRGPRRDFSPRG